jgi:alpha(1,3/1,4) fucosyltransferase
MRIKMIRSQSEYSGYTNELAIGFAKWPADFDYQNNFIINSLKKHFSVQISATPSIVFYSVFKGQIPEGKYVKVFFTGENRRPDFAECDWAFTFDYDDTMKHPRHLRLPLYVLDAYGMTNFRFDWGEALIKSSDYADRISGQKKYFCAYIAKIDSWPRIAMFDYLSCYKQVTAPGKSRNNVPPISHNSYDISRMSADFQDEKRSYLKKFKFAIVFENSAYPGYTTEKLVDAMLSGCIPIYWGNSEVGKDFNTKSFINVHEFEQQIEKRIPNWIRNWTGLYKHIWKLWVTPQTLKKVVEQVKEIDKKKELYLSMLKQPWFHNNRVNEYFSLERFESQLIKIVNLTLSEKNSAKILSISRNKWCG